MKARCFAYCRVSTLEQLNGSGLDMQLDVITKYCKANNIDIVRVYNEQVSGTKGEDERPIYQQMVADCKAENISMVIIDRIDRFARWWTICETLYLDLAVKKIDVVLASTGENITQSIKDSPIKKFIVHVLGGVAELDYSQICDRLKKGRQAKVKNHGEWRARQYGKCDLTCNSKTGEHSERCKHERAILKRIRHDRKTTKTFKEIAADLNAEGIFTRSGKLWNDVLVFNVQRPRKK